MVFVYFKRFSAASAVVRILLDPVPGDEIVVIYVVAEQALATSTTINFLASESWIAPILVERHCFGHAHCIDHAFLRPIVLRTCANNPVTDRRSSADVRLTCCERAISVKRIRGEAIVTSDDVGVELQDLGPRAVVSWNV